MARKDLGGRIDRWAKRNPLIVAVSLTAVVVAAVVTLVGAVSGGIKWYERTFQWRSAEYARLEGLRAGFTVARFEHVLGVPLFSRQIADSDLTEDTFRGRGYWVQVDSGDNGTALLYAVTSCSLSFTPTFAVPGDGNGAQQAHVTLNRTVPDAVLHGSAKRDILADYYQGNTADTYFYDVWYGANPGFYKGFVWGLNDACPDWFRVSGKLEREGLLPEAGERDFDGHVDEGGASVKRFRREVPVNTFAETAPGTYLFEIGQRGHRTGNQKPEVHIGVDRILVRTVTGVN